MSLATSRIRKMIRQATPDLSDLSEGELPGFLVKIADASEGTAYLITASTKAFLRIVGQE